MRLNEPLGIYQDDVIIYVARNWNHAYTELRTMQPRPSTDPQVNIAPPNPVNQPQPQTKGYVGISEDERVIKNLADLFNGQIVDLDEEADEQ